ncbi:SPOR domain-containing protein [Acidovorax sp.]|uniref:SPOR domain-containing protein n=1 Tax=Acidovorax sp. TaxID=1872122 RepID=UPI00391EF554
MTELGMRANPDPADSKIPATSLDSTSDNAMNALYRAALGPLNSAYYLPVFERFDATGRTTTTWNWAASLFTLGWMVFRQLWGPALVYVAAAEGLALLVFALCLVLLQWPQGIEWGVLATVALLAFAVPGLYGNALLHNDIRKRITRALAASRTVPEACELLAGQASTRRRLQLLVLGHVAIVAAAAVAYLLIPQDTSNRPFAMEPELTVAQAASASAAASAPVAAEAVGAETKAPATPLAAASTAAPNAAQDTASVAPAATATPASAVAPSAPPAAAVSETRAPDTEGPAPLTPPDPPAAAAAPASAASPPRKPASPLPRDTASQRKATAQATPSAATAASRAASKPPKNASAASASASNSTPATSDDAVPPPAGSLPGYYINVGLFAQEANARKAQARLLNEGLPAFRQELSTPAGRRIRVRVGPYPTRALANKAADTIKAMQLEAVVFKQ